MFRGNPKENHLGRRSFIKATTMAGVAATLPATGLTGQERANRSKPGPGGSVKRLLVLNDNPETYAQLVDSIKKTPGIDVRISSIKVNYQQPDAIIRTIHEQNADILLLCLPRMTFSFGSLYDSMGDLDIPVIVLTPNPELILIDAHLVASLRGNGADVTFAISQDQALEEVKIAASPGILEGRRAVLYGRPFDSTSAPCRNLTEDIVYRRTGVRMEYRPVAELESRIKEVDDAAAQREMERWKREATEVTGITDEDILDACRLYVLMRSMVEKEGLSAVSIDCLGITMNRNSVLPFPCLAFARLRDEGITAACEADVCGMISSMFLEEITRKPSFMCNLMSVDPRDSKIVVSHCVAPLKLNGPNAAAMKYKLHDYHNYGRGVVPEVEFPMNSEVITGGFSKDLKSFALWPGRIESQVKDTDQLSASDGRPLNACANTMDVKISDPDRFLQNIPGIHQVMVTGSYTRKIEDALSAMNVELVGPVDFKPPAA